MFILNVSPSLSYNDIYQIWKWYITGKQRFTILKYGERKRTDDLSLVTPPQGPLLLTWINFHPGTDKWSYAKQSVDWIYLSIAKYFQRLHSWRLGLDE